jgi:hypothetical protein
LKVKDFMKTLIPAFSRREKEKIPSPPGRG